MEYELWSTKLETIQLMSPRDRGQILDNTVEGSLSDEETPLSSLGVFWAQDEAQE